MGLGQFGDDLFQPVQPFLGAALGLGQLLDRGFQSLQSCLGSALGLGQLFQLFLGAALGFGEGDQGGSQLVLPLLQGAPYVLTSLFPDRDQPLDQFPGGFLTQAFFERRRQGERVYGHR